MTDTQCQKVLNHIKENGTITTYEAFSKYGITRLPSRIWDLRQAGHEIESYRKDTPDTHYNVYYLKK